MMKMVLLVVGLCLTPLLHSQEFVKVRLVEKGTTIETPFSMTIRVANRDIEPLRFQNGFVVPPEIAKVEFVDITVRFKRYSLTFPSVSTKKFDGDWTLGVDSPPFSPEFAEEDHKTLGNKRLRFIYYVKFDPKQGDGTQQVERIYK